MIIEEEDEDAVTSQAEQTPHLLQFALLDLKKLCIFIHHRRRRLYTTHRTNGWLMFPAEFFTA